MTSTQYKGLSSNRVVDPSGVNTADLECSVCHDLLWKPIACQTCETPFCSTCMDQWLQGNSKCPNGCKNYMERKCPPFVAKLLAHLQVSCFYQPKGCPEVLSYEALNKHENECGYQSEQCQVCKLDVLKKDFEDHKRNCSLKKSSSQDQKLVYSRGGSGKRQTDNVSGRRYSDNNSGRKRTDNFSLKEQLRQLQQEFEDIKYKIHMVTNQINDMHTDKKPISQVMTITFDDLPSAAEETKWVPNKYNGFNWTKIVYMENSYAMETYPKSGYVTAFMPGGSSHIAFFNEEAVVSSEESNETFTLVSLTACAAWNDNLHLTISGYRNSIQVNTHTSTLIFGKPQVIILLWRNIDKITFQPSGGTLHQANKELESDTHCILTQLTIN